MILKDTLIQVTNENYCRTDYRHLSNGYQADIILADRDKISITAFEATNLELWEIRAFVTSHTTVKLRCNKPYTALSYTPNMALFEEKPGSDSFYGYSFNLTHERSICSDLTLNSHVPYTAFLIYINDKFLAEHKQEFGWIHRFRTNGVPPEKPVIASAVPIPVSLEITDLLMDVSEISNGKRESAFLKIDIDYLASQTLYELDTVFRWQYAMRKYNVPSPF